MKMTIIKCHRNTQPKYYSYNEKMNIIDSNKNKNKVLHLLQENMLPLLS